VPTSDDPADCWEATGPREANGYVRLNIHGKRVLAHRISWELHYGPIPPGMFVCHHCDNRACCRPSHLFLGTDVDNIRDMVAKDRHPRGERCGRSKTTDRDVQAMRADAALGVSVHTLAARYALEVSTVRYILNRTTWKHLE
jgi:hypothetical protein